MVLCLCTSILWQNARQAQAPCTHVGLHSHVDLTATAVLAAAEQMMTMHADILPTGAGSGSGHWRTPSVCASRLCARCSPCPWGLCGRQSRRAWSSACPRPSSHPRGLPPCSPRSGSRARCASLCCALVTVSGLRGALLHLAVLLHGHGVCLPGSQSWAAPADARVPIS